MNKNVLFAAFMLIAGQVSLAVLPSVVKKTSAPTSAISLGFDEGFEFFYAQADVPAEVARIADLTVFDLNIDDDIWLDHVGAVPGAVLLDFDRAMVYDFCNFIKKGASGAVLFQYAHCPRKTFLVQFVFRVNQPPVVTILGSWGVARPGSIPATVVAFVKACCFHKNQLHPAIKVAGALAAVAAIVAVGVKTKSVAFPTLEQKIRKALERVNVDKGIVEARIVSAIGRDLASAVTEVLPPPNVVHSPASPLVPRVLILAASMIQKDLLRAKQSVLCANKESLQEAHCLFFVIDDVDSTAAWNGVGEPSAAGELFRSRDRSDCSQSHGFAFVSVRRFKNDFYCNFNTSMGYRYVPYFYSELASSSFDEANEHVFKKCYKNLYEDSFWNYSSSYESFLGFDEHSRGIVGSVSKSAKLRVDEVSRRSKISVASLPPCALRVAGPQLMSVIERDLSLKLCEDFRRAFISVGMSGKRFITLRDVTELWPARLDELKLDSRLWAQYFLDDLSSILIIPESWLGRHIFDEADWLCLHGRKTLKDFLISSSLEVSSRFLIVNDNVGKKCAFDGAGGFVVVGQGDLRATYRGKTFIGGKSLISGCSEGWVEGSVPSDLRRALASPVYSATGVMNPLFEYWDRTFDLRIPRAGW